MPLHFWFHCLTGSCSWRLRIVRYCFAQANPRLRTGCPNVQHRLEGRLIVERGKTNGHVPWRSFATREQRRSTVWAEAAGRQTTAARTNRVRLRCAGDLQVRDHDDDTGGERSAAGPLAVAAMAVEHRDWRTRAHIADRSAGAPAGKWGNHVAVSSSAPSPVKLRASRRTTPRPSARDTGSFHGTPYPRIAEEGTPGVIDVHPARYVAIVQ